LPKSRRSVALVGALALGLAGVAAVLSFAFDGGGHSASRPRAPNQNTVDTVPVSSSGNDGFLAFAIGGRPRSLESVLRVFSARRTASDNIPSGAFLDPAFVPISDANLRKSRLLVAGYGVRIYGVPADDGSLCRVYVPDVGGGCASTVYHGGYPELDWTDSDRVLVSGVTENDVGRVDVRVGKRWHRARLGRNAYLYELPAGVAHPHAVVIRERGGAKHTFQFVR
jgi:hypothetical protein